MTKDMTEGKPLKLIVSFCVPLMVGNLFQQLYNMVDTVIVGQYVGKDALSAVGSTGSLLFLVLGLVLGICSGFSVIVAQNFGAHDEKMLRRSLFNSIVLSAALALAMTAITVSLTRPILRLMNTPDEIFADAYFYIVTIFAGLGATVFYNYQAAILRAIGDSKTPLCFLIVSSLLNIALDLLFIRGFSMGVFGAALATVIAQLISGLLCFAFILKRFAILRLTKEDCVIDKKCCLKLLYTGIPMGLQFSITSLGSVMLQSAVNGLGSDVIAAVTVAGKMQLMFVQPMEAIGITMATYCGQNLGARRISRISAGVRRSILLAIIYSVAVGSVAWFASPYIALLFVKKTEVAVIALTKEFLRWHSCFYPVLGILFVLRNAIQGIGKSVPAMAAGFFELIARGAFGLWVVPKYGFAAVRITHAAAWAAADLLLVPLYFYEVHKLKKAHPETDS